MNSEDTLPPRRTPLEPGDMWDEPEPTEVGHTKDGAPVLELASGHVMAQLGSVAITGHIDALQADFSGTYTLRAELDGVTVTRENIRLSPLEVTEGDLLPLLERRAGPVIWHYAGPGPDGEARWRPAMTRGDALLLSDREMTWLSQQTEAAAWAILSVAGRAWAAGYDAGRQYQADGQKAALSGHLLPVPPKNPLPTR